MGRRHFSGFLFVLWTALAGAQEGQSFAVGEKVDESAAGDRPELLGDFTLTFELFSVPMARAAEMKRHGKAEGALYEELVEAVTAGEVDQDHFMEVRSSAGQSVQIEQIREYIYATEFDPPEVGQLPGKLPPGFKDFDRFITPATPTSFETKNLGETLEVELNAHPDHPEKLVGRITFTHVSLKGVDTWGKEESEVKMPRFEVQKIRAAVTMEANQPVHVGGFADPGEDRQERVWMAFARFSRVRVSSE